MTDKREEKVDEALGLKMISIRLDVGLIEDFKMLGAISRMPYQSLMREALKGFASSEKTNLLRAQFEDLMAKRRKHAAQASAEPNQEEVKQ